ncbi:hypothetical protein V4890_15465 [Ralstonia solanacearum species complex bacterium KE056]|uniref:hypothetical protein n=1 Tax=Ralstonia solanacearum species complex bacterium KE056 TaxID=3119585 RepID=UPI002FC3501E
MIRVESISSPVEFFKSLGGLHDASVNGISWDMKNKSMEITVDDINSNFEGLPEYKGKKPASIVFIDVGWTKFSVDVFDRDVCRIYDVDVTEVGLDGGFEFVVKLSPGGKIELACREINIVDLG